MDKISNKVIAVFGPGCGTFNTANTGSSNYTTERRKMTPTPLKVCTATQSINKMANKESYNPNHTN